MSDMKALLLVVTVFCAGVALAETERKSKSIDPAAPPPPPKPYAQGAALPSQDGAVRLWTASAGWKVFPENPLPQNGTDAVRIQTAANEAECAQFVVTPSRTLSGVRVRAEGLPGMLAAEVLRVSCVCVTVPSDATCAPGLWPETLEPQTAGGCCLAAGESMAFWVRVKAAKGAKADVYRGALVLEADGFAMQRVPLEVEVFDFELPDTMTCETAFACRTGGIDAMCRLKNPGDRRLMHETCFRILAEHHLSIYPSSLETPLKVSWKGLEHPETAEPVFNWSEWDAAVERCMREFHMNTIKVPVIGLGGGTYLRRREAEIAGFKRGTAEYEMLVARYLRALEAHIADRGWLDRAYVYWFDEPRAKDYDFVNEGLAVLKRHAPRLRRMMTAKVTPEMADGVSLWCPLASHLRPGDTAAARARGEGFWWYLCCSSKAPYVTEFIDKPGTELRVWLWQTWKEGATGILVWETAYWSGGYTYSRREVKQNFWADAMSWCDAFQYAWGNGDGRFLYPPRAAMDFSCTDPVLDPPLETIRLEMLRDGLEDYEYFAMLRRLDPRNALLSVPADVTASLSEFTCDPEPMLRHRERIAREIQCIVSGLHR